MEWTGIIGILGQVKVTLGWADDTGRRQYGRQWRGCWGRRGMPPLEGYRAAGGEGGAGQEYLCNNNQQSLGFGDVTV